jgi:hypothetical protein
MALQHLRASTADKRPTPAAMADGQLAMNTNLASPGLFFKDSNGDLVKTGPVHVGTTAPNATPASGGQAGNSKGELWLDTTGSDYTLKTWDGSAWREIVVTSTMIKDGTIVNADVNASAAIAGTKVSPDFGSQNLVTTGTATAASLNPTGSSVPTNGVYLPATNSVAISTNGTGRLTVGTTAVSSTLAVDHPLGAVGTPSITFTGDLNTGFWSPTADTLAASTNGAERLRITSTGAVGIGTTSPSNLLHISSAASTSYLDLLRATNSGTGTGTNAGILFANGDGISTAAGSIGRIKAIDLGGFKSALAFETSQRAAYGDTTTEAMRIDGSGRLLVGTSTSTSFAGIQPVFQGYGNSGSAASIGLARVSADADAGNLILGKARGAVGSEALPSANDTLGSIRFHGWNSDWSNTAATISCAVDGEPGTSGDTTDMPGRLVFSTTADGASSPTERMRIDSAGRMLVGTSANSGGARIQASGSVQASLAFRVPANNRNGGTCKPIAIETISTDGGTNTATVFGNSRYGTGKWVLLAAFNPSGDAVSATTSVGPGSTFVFCITDAASNFPTS